MSQRVYQCPGCWAHGLYEDPLPGNWWECNCGEKLTMIDLRRPADQSPSPDAERGG